MYRHSYIEVDLNKIKFNLNKIKKSLDKTDELCATVKANAYGLGLVEISKFLFKHNVKVFGVTSLNEALSLRRAIKNCKIIIYSPFPITKENISLVKKNNFSILITSPVEFKKIVSLKQKNISCHIKIDEGMNRTGFKSDEELLFLQKNANSILKIEGIFSHLPNTVAKNNPKTKKALTAFSEKISALKKCGFKFNTISILNSSGIFNYIKVAKKLFPNNINLVRPGFSLYEGAISVKTKIISVKELKNNETYSYGDSLKATKKMCIGVLPIGYADGISFQNENLNFYISKNKVKVLAVNMDHTYIDITSLSNKNNKKYFLYKEVTILIKNNIKNLEELSLGLNTFPYELYTKLGNSRLEKIYKSK